MDKLTRQGLADWVAQQSGLPKSQSYELVGEVLWAMTRALAEGAAVELRDFGVFEVYERKARQIQVPGKGKVRVPRRKDVSFQPGKLLREWLNEPEQQ